tara:strand:+ start:426 stop:1367 length:942 start_codon:yes stop_codon:yes gene_type:complete
MKSKAQVSERFRNFDANLTTRPWIVIGMGVRKFTQLLSIRTWTGYGVWALITLVYLLTLFRFILLADADDYPCIEYDEGIQRCLPLDFYGDFGSATSVGGIRLFLVILAAIASGGLIGNDMTNKTIHLYLSRPISRLDYLIARFIPVFLLLMFVTFVPNLIILSSMWSENGLETDWLLDHKWLIINLILQGILYSASYSIIGLTFSTLLKKEATASSAFFLFIYGTSIISETFFFFLEILDVDGSEYVLLLSVSHLLDIVSYAIFDTTYYVSAFGIPIEAEIGNLEIGAWYTCIIAGCSGFMYWMIQQMEANK